jgi:hypothetical protein
VVTASTANVDSQQFTVNEREQLIYLSVEAAEIEHGAANRNLSLSRQEKGTRTFGSDSYW